MKPFSWNIAFFLTILILLHTACNSSNKHSEYEFEKELSEKRIVCNCRRSVEESEAFMPHIVGMKRTYQVSDFVADTLIYQYVQEIQLDSTYVDTIYTGGKKVKETSKTILFESYHCPSQIHVYSVTNSDKKRWDHKILYAVCGNTTYQIEERFRTRWKDGFIWEESKHYRNCLLNEDSLFVGYRHNDTSHFTSYSKMLEGTEAVTADGMSKTQFNVVNTDTMITINNVEYPNVVRLWASNRKQGQNSWWSHEWYYAKGIGLIYEEECVNHDHGLQKTTKLLLEYEL